MTAVFDGDGCRACAGYRLMNNLVSGHHMYVDDLITGEPPPITHVGTVNLYIEEYFTLLRSRLRAGGFVTYWLPVWTRCAGSFGKTSRSGPPHACENCSATN